MAFLKLYRDKLRHNYEFLDDLFSKHNIEWGVVTKMLCGYEDYLREACNLGAMEVHDARVSNLKKIKKLNPEVQTVYIKPPPKRSIKSIVRYADASFNTEYATIKMLSDEAKQQNNHHKIIIMIEMGDLREGVMGEDLVDFYARIFELPNISVVGLGTNLNCLHGVLPTRDKLIQLSLYKQIIELKFNVRIPWISGGSSVMIPLIYNKQLPRGVNHFRVGESLFFGNDLINEQPIKGMHTDVFELFTEIIEISEKPMVPMGETGANVMGEQTEVKEEMYGKRTHRAIIDIGQLDINPKFLVPKDEDIKLVGASSDMLILDLGDNEKDYKVGDLVRWELKYMGALHLMSSSYIDKKVE